MNCEIKPLLAMDCKQRTANAASIVESHLSTGAVKEAWHALKGWYRSAEDQPSPACPDTMDNQMAKRVELYERATPMGAPLPFNSPFFEISNNMPTDLEVHTVVRRLKNGRAGGATGMKTEHLKLRLDKIQYEEKAVRENPGREGADPGLGHKWRIFIELIQTIWERGEILEQMSGVGVVLLPKGGSNFRGIGLLDPCWKMVDNIMVGCLATIDFHPCFTVGYQNTGQVRQQLRLSWHSNWPGWSKSRCIKSIGA